MDEGRSTAAAGDAAHGLAPAVPGCRGSADEP